MWQVRTVKVCCTCAEGLSHVPCPTQVKRMLMQSPSLLGINVSSRRFLETIEALKAALGVTGTPYHLVPRHINVWLHITMLRL